MQTRAGSRIAILLAVLLATVSSSGCCCGVLPRLYQGLRCATCSRAYCGGTGCQPVRIHSPVSDCEPCDNHGNWIGGGPAIVRHGSTFAHHESYPSEGMMVGETWSDGEIAMEQPYYVDPTPTEVAQYPPARMSRIPTYPRGGTARQGYRLR